MYYLVFVCRPWITHADFALHQAWWLVSVKISLFFIPGDPEISSRLVYLRRPLLSFFHGKPGMDPSTPEDAYLQTILRGSTKKIRIIKKK